VKAFRAIKKEIRIIGVDDGVFTPRKKGRAEIIGVVYRGGSLLNGVLKTDVEIDGTDATDKITEMITCSRHYPQLRVIMLYGLTFAGLNVVNIEELYKKTKLPVIVVMEKKPNVREIEEAIRRLNNYEARLEALKSAGEVTLMKTKTGSAPIYLQSIGLTEKEVEEIIKISCVRSRIPEPLRAAHIIASAVKSKFQHISRISQLS
jgi:endonuclease V-like protein UPF0215 family